MVSRAFGRLACFRVRLSNYDRAGDVHNQKMSGWAGERKRVFQISKRAVCHTQVLLNRQRTFHADTRPGNNEARSTRYRWLADKVIYLFK